MILSVLSIFHRKMGQNERFSIFHVQILSSNFYLRASFAKLFNFKLSKNCWNNPKLYKRILAHFEKMSLARWFERFTVGVKLLPPRGFPNAPKSFYIILDFFNKFLKTWSWKSWQKKSGDLDLEDRIWRLELEKRLFWPVLRGKTLLFFNAQNQRARLIFSKWAKILVFNCGLFQQVFNNLTLNNPAKEARRLKLKSAVWR